jgi:hypothetical protein
MAGNESRLVGVARDATTIMEISAAFEEEGFRGQFGSGERGEVECFTCKRRSPAETMTVEHLRRLEGASDPADMLAIVALTCPHCDTPGTLILNYGPVATIEDDTRSCAASNNRLHPTPPRHLCDPNRRASRTPSRQTCGMSARLRATRGMIWSGV